MRGGLACTWYIAVVSGVSDWNGGRPDASL